MSRPLYLAFPVAEPTEPHFPLFKQAQTVIYRKRRSERSRLYCRLLLFPLSVFLYYAKPVPIFLCKVDYSSKKGGQHLSFKADPEIPFHTLRPTFLSNPIDPYPLFCKGSGKSNLCSIRNTSLKQTKIRIPCSPFLAGFFPIPFHKKKGFRCFSL